MTGYSINQAAILPTDTPAYDIIAQLQYEKQAPNEPSHVNLIRLQGVQESVETIKAEQIVL
jgi:hypothetical protein